MALKQVEDYYLQIEEQYYKMLEIAKEFDKEIANNLFEVEEAKELQKRVNKAHKTVKKIEERYKSLAYIIYLLGLDEEGHKRDKDLDEAFKDIDRNKIVLNNDKILNKFKSYIAELKEKSGNEGQ